MNKNIIIVAITILLPIVAVIMVSRSLAIKSANEVIAPVKSELHLVSCRPYVLRFKDGHPIGSITGIGWRVAYNTDRCFITHDLEIYSSLLGKIMSTNPIDLKNRIKGEVRVCQ